MIARTTRRHRRAAGVAGALVAAGAAACAQGFDGANVQLDLSPAMPVQASSAATTPGPGELPAASHFTLYAIQTGEGDQHLFAIGTFEVHRIVDLQSPCFIDVGAHVPHPGLHVSQYATVIGEDVGVPDVTNPPTTATDADKIAAATAVQRERDVALLAGPSGLHAVTSASAATYPPVAATCADAMANAALIPPPACVAEVSNAQRLALCQAAWTAAADLWEGTDRILTSPLAGTTRGFVDGQNPINLSPVGGAQFFVDTVLTGIDALAIYAEPDGAAGTGDLVLYGTPTTPTRGVIHVHMTNATTPALFADLAIFSNLGQDDSSF